MTPAARRQWLALLAALWLVASSPAESDGALIGEPTVSVARRQMRLESESDYSLRDVKLDGLCCLESESVRLLLKVSGRLHERVELFGKLGGALLHTLELPGGPDVEGSADIAVGGGLKVTLYEEGPVAWGAGAQVLYHETEDDRLNQRLSWHEVDLFAGPALTIQPGVTAYGGLLGALVVGELRGPGGALDLAELRPLGFFLGGRVDVTRAASFGLELRLINELSFSSRVGISF